MRENTAHTTYTLLLKTIIKIQTEEKVKWHHRELGLFVLTAALHLFIILLIILFMGGGCREGGAQKAAKGKVHLETNTIVVSPHMYLKMGVNFPQPPSRDGSGRYITSHHGSKCVGMICKKK